MFRYPTSSKLSSEDESVLVEPAQEYRNEVSPAEGILNKKYAISWFFSLHTIY